MNERRRCWRHSDGGAQQEDAARHPEVGRGIGSERPRLPKESCYTLPRRGIGSERPKLPKEVAARKPGKKADQPRPSEESYEAPGEQMPQGGEHTGSPRIGGGDCSGAQHQVDSATESPTDTVGRHQVPMYQVIGLSVTVALLILLLCSL